MINVVEALVIYNPYTNIDEVLLGTTSPIALQPEAKLAIALVAPPFEGEDYVWRVYGIRAETRYWGNPAKFWRG